MLRLVNDVCTVRNPENNAMTGSGFVEFDSVSKATQVLQEVSEINLEYAIDKVRCLPSSLPPFALRSRPA
jgi:hypothetical protein